MHEFLPNALGLLQRYRLLLKKQLPKELSDKILMKLELHRRLPQEELSAYRLITDVVNHLKKEAVKYEKVRFSGKLRILADMQGLLDRYCLEGDKLLNVSQEASKAMIEAIQLMMLPATEYTKKLSVQLKKCSLKVAQYGMQEQHQIFGRSLEKQLERDESFFSPIIQYYQKHLKKYTRVAEDTCRVDEGR